jgi:osmotically-inducible protein OsmY
MSELTLQQVIMQALADDPQVFADEISAQVVGADVTLHGTVGSRFQRDAAAAATRVVPGVRHIDNQLRVRILGSDRREDADLQAAVTDALIADPGLHAASLDAVATAGTVTLRGVVDSDALRGQAAQIAYEVPGVSEVRNRLEIAS